jgi:pimeloyl-ACP methyl ester carboxylesterase
MLQSHTNKSTNVRSIAQARKKKVLLGRLRLGIGALQRVSPSLAARALELVFLSPERHARPLHERDAFLSASRSSLYHQGRRVPLYAWGEPSRPVVLFAHGWAGRATQVAPYLAPLLAAGFRVVSYDTPGHGEAARALVSVVDFALVAEQVARSLSGQVQAAIGHSAGAAALTVAAGRFSFAERIVAIAPPLQPRSYMNQFMKYMRVSKQTEQSLLARLEARYPQVPFVELDSRDYVAKIEAEGLVLHDRADAEVPFAHGEALAGAWPKARFIATEGLGHRRILRDPEVVRAALEFIGPPRTHGSLEHAIEREPARRAVPCA